MRFLLDAPFAVFDLETTGVNVETDRIVTGCVGLLWPGPPGEPWRQQIESHLAAVDNIPAEATTVHGITTAFAQANGKPPTEVIFNITHRLTTHLRAGAPLIGTNISYDLTILDRECRRHSVPRIDDLGGGCLIEPVIDVYVLDKWLDPYRSGGRKLTDLIDWYGVRHEGAHDSTADALAAGRVAYRMAQAARSDHVALTQFFRGHGRKRPEEIADRFAMLDQMNPATLHANQVRWRAEQQASLREYLNRMRRAGDPPPDCDPHWPVRPFNTEEVNQNA